MTPTATTRPAAEPDEFDLDLRLGELAAWRSGTGGLLVDAQTDGVCVPTGGRGAGTTCDTRNDTCAVTCAGRDTCPNTLCGRTCPRTDCGATCDTCPRTDCGCPEPTQLGTHCPTCRNCPR